MNNPMASEELRASIAAIKEALADMEAGDVGRPVHDVVDELRKKHGLPSQPCTSFPTAE
jgi:hypothetical protein